MIRPVTFVSIQYLSDNPQYIQPMIKSAPTRLFHFSCLFFFSWHHVLASNSFLTNNESALRTGVWLSVIGALIRGTP